MSPNAARQRKKRVTWEDYLTWPDDERWEIKEQRAKFGRGVN